MTVFGSFTDILILNFVMNHRILGFLEHIENNIPNGRSNQNKNWVTREKNIFNLFDSIQKSIVQVELGINYLRKCSKRIPSLLFEILIDVQL